MKQQPVETIRQIAENTYNFPKRKRQLHQLQANIWEIVERGFGNLANWEAVQDELKKARSDFEDYVRLHLPEEEQLAAVVSFGSLMLQNRLTRDSYSCRMICIR